MEGWCRQLTANAAPSINPRQAGVEELEKELATRIWRVHLSANDPELSIAFAFERLGIVGTLELQPLEIFRSNVTRDVLT
jgi:hypothetical protein